MQGFLEPVWRESYGRYGMTILANPNDPESVRKQAERVDASDMSLPRHEDAAYFLLLNPENVAEPEAPETEPDISALLKFSNYGEGVIELEELDVKKGRRGHGLGALAVSKALDFLSLSDDTKLRIEVLRHNVRAQAFYENSMGAVATGETIYHDWAFPSPEDYHVVYEVTVGEAKARLASYLAERPATRTTEE